MDVVFLFPLLSLPRDALRNVFRIMCYAKVFGISLLSTKAKNLIASLELHSGASKKIRVGVSRMLVVRLSFPHNKELSVFLHYLEVNAAQQEIVKPIHLIVNELGQGTSICTNSGNRTVNQIIEHLKTVFHRTKLELKLRPTYHQFDLDSIHKAVGNVDRIWIDSPNHEHNQKVLKLFKPPKLVLNGNAIQNNKVPETILMGNFNKLELNAPVLQLTLDEMLLINSKEIIISKVNLSGKDLNRFLKLWIAGSNPNLEMIDITFMEGVVVSEEMVYAGLGCQDVTEVRFFKSPRWIVHPMKEIMRNDGIKASVHLYRFENHHSFQMVVWHHHCIVQEANH